MSTPAPSERTDTLVEDLWRSLLEFERAQNEEGQTLTGPCPVCEHTMTVDLPDVAPLESVGFGPTAGGGTPHDHLVRCNCFPGHHDAKGTTSEGCGAYGNVSVGP